jgi:hypothetical protein
MQGTNAEVHLHGAHVTSWKTSQGEVCTVHDQDESIEAKNVL